MTVGELKSALADMPNDSHVQICDPYNNTPYEIEFVEEGSEYCTSEKGYVFINVVESENKE